MSTIFFGITSLFLYLWVSFRLGVRLFGNRTEAIDKKLPIVVGMGAVTFHGLVINATLVTPEGFNFSFFNAVSLLSWLISLLILLAAVFKPVENLGIALFPIAAISVALSLIFPAGALHLNDAKVGLDIHILISILAFSFLNIAAIQAILLALQNRQLRQRHPGGFIRALPPLQTMEQLLFQMIGLGFILQTLSLASGFVFLEDMFAQHMVHKTVLAITAWAVFAILLWGRWRFGWRGRTAIRWTLGGFISLLLAYFGSKMVLELVLSQ
jgi:ABC-type uncharacterized transport system permease subunit